MIIFNMVPPGNQMLPPGQNSSSEGQHADSRFSSSALSLAQSWIHEEPNIRTYECVCVCVSVSLSLSILCVRARPFLQCNIYLSNISIYIYIYRSAQDVHTFTCVYNFAFLKVLSLAFRDSAWPQENPQSLRPKDEETVILKLRSPGMTKELDCTLPHFYLQS